MRVRFMRVRTYNFSVSFAENDEQAEKNVVLFSLEKSSKMFSQDCTVAAADDDNRRKRVK